MTHKYERKTVLGQLKSMLKLFENEKRWLKGNFAASDQGDDNTLFYNGNEVSLKEYPNACWCLVGAAQFVTPQDQWSPGVSSNSLPTAGLLVKAVRSTGVRNVYDTDDIYFWNDNKNRTIKDVRAVLKKAINLAGG